MGEAQAKVWQDYETYALILASAFGSSNNKNKPTPKPEQLAENMSIDQMVAQFNKVMG